MFQSSCFWQITLAFWNSTHEDTLCLDYRQTHIFYILHPYMEFLVTARAFKLQSKSAFAPCTRLITLHDMFSPVWWRWEGNWIACYCTSNIIAELGQKVKLPITWGMYMFFCVVALATLPDIRRFACGHWHVQLTRWYNSCNYIQEVAGFTCLPEPDIPVLYLMFAAFCIRTSGWGLCSFAFARDQRGFLGGWNLGYLAEDCSTRPFSQVYIYIYKEVFHFISESLGHIEGQSWRNCGIL